MIKVETSVVINRPVEEVFEFVAAPENTSQWVSGLLEAKRVSKGSVALGAKSTQVRQFLGQQMKTTFEVAEYEPNKKLAFKTHAGPLKFEGAITFESVEGSTKVSIIAQAETRGFFKKAEKIAPLAAQRQMETDFATLKALLETQG